MLSLLWVIIFFGGRGMTIRSSATLALVLGLGVALAGCDKLNEVRAMKAFKDGNKAYAASDWRAAAARTQPDYGILRPS